MRRGKRGGDANQRFLHNVIRVGFAPMGEVSNAHCGESEPDLLGWTLWPEREDLSIELLRLLGAAQAGGATIAECRVTAGRIDPSDDHSWYREWKHIADTNRERGDVALREGHVLTAKSNWLRAINYYQSAAFPFDRDDGHCRGAIASMRQCARDYLQHFDPRGEVLLIPWPGGYPLEAYFLPAAEASAQPSPAIICVGEPGHRKEEFLCKVARYARERGMSLLAVDLHGAGTDSQLDQIVGRSDLETTVGHITDHLVEREDVDSSRIAILADGWGLPSWLAALPLTTALPRPHVTAASGTCMSAPSLLSAPRSRRSFRVRTSISAGWRATSNVPS
jgi:hypothetical protein